MPVLAAYNEIALKSSFVRSNLERTLAQQILFMLRKGGFREVRVSRLQGRILVEGVPPEAARIVARVFGVVAAIPAEDTDTSLASVVALVRSVAAKTMKPGQGFAVRPRVTGSVDYGSQDVAVKAGAAVLEAMRDRGVRVNLSQPDVTFGVEVREKRAYVYTETIHGVSGLPYGSQGEAVALFSGGIDSPVASWMMMKRGVDVSLLFMDQSPYVGASYLQRAVEAAKVIRGYVPSDAFSLHIAPMGAVMEQILQSPEPRFTCILCKRSMYRIAQRFVQARGARAIITGESLGQVASQTLENLTVLDAAVSVPVLRPLIGTDKVDIENMARVIGTYDITAHKVEGCKAVPDTPATRSVAEHIAELEAFLGLERLCAEATDGVEARAIP